MAINGKAYSHSSITAVIRGKSFAIDDINYEPTIERNMVFGNRRVARKKTKGKFMVNNCSLTMSKDEFDAMRLILGPGFMDREFNVTVAYVEVDETGSSSSIDELLKCSFKSAKVSSKEGPEDIKVNCEFDCQFMLFDGISPVDLSMEEIIQYGLGV